MSATYTTQAISGYNSDPPADDGTKTNANRGSWATIKTKLADPNKTLTEAINTELVSFLNTTLPNVLHGSVNGCGISNNSLDAEHDLDIARGACVDTTGAYIMLTTSTDTIAIDAAAGIDSIDTGTVAASTLYAVWRLMNPSTGAVGHVFSTAFTLASVTLPSGYTVGQRIGAVLTNASSNIIEFVQTGNYVYYKGESVNDVNDTSITDETYETATLSVPPSALAHIYGRAGNASTNDNDMTIWIRHKDGHESIGSAGSAFNSVNTDTTLNGAGSQGLVLVNSSQQVEYGMTATHSPGTASLTIRTIGYHDYGAGNAS